MALMGAGACSPANKPPEARAEPTEAQERAPAASKAAAPTASALPATTSTTGDESVDGYQLVRSRTKDGNVTTIAVKPPAGWQIMQAPTSPDPQGGKFTLAEATQGLPAEGTLVTRIKTSLGSFYCDLFGDKTPNTVANFVGLARGRRKFWDTEKLAWVARPYYDGTTFHRVVPGFMIQGGDQTGTGRGGIGYMFKDEMEPTLHHDRPGQLCMANRGPNTNEAQFFITEGAAPHLEGSFTIFGQCEPATLVQRIARVPQSGAPANRPLTPVVIEKVEIKRVVGGIAKWMPESAKLPPLEGLPAPGRAVQVSGP
jgi:peptidyl-prolyl cis-trans isomerase A (cyclophilin A)